MEETIGLAILYPEIGRPAYLFRRANPKAIPDLWALIETGDDGVSEIHANAYHILGYVGDDADAQKMLDHLRSYSGVLNFASHDRFRAIISGLAMMRWRGIATAIAGLNEMTSVRYWKNRVKYKPDNLLRESDLPPELESVYFILSAQGRLNEDWPQKFQSVLSEIPNEKHRQIIKSRFDELNQMREAGETVIIERDRQVTEAEQRGLRILYEKRSAIIADRSKARREMMSKTSPPWRQPKPLTK